MILSSAIDRGLGPPSREGTTKPFFLGVLTTLVALLAGAYVLLRSGTIPVNADSKPLPLEIWAAHTALRAAVRRDSPKGPDPVPATPGHLMRGLRLYTTHCTICHGTVRGNAAAPPLARGEYPRPPQFASHGVERGRPGAIFWKIAHGIRWTGMPSWKRTLTDHEIWTLALFLKHMDRLPPPVARAWRHVKVAPWPLPSHP